MTERVEVFIDGFNVYYGMREAGLGSSRWLDYVALAKRLNTSREVVRVNYYTARVTKDPAAADRQATYLDALAAHARSAHVGVELRIIYGRLQWEPRKCGLCHKESNYPIEKHTDVNLATDMVLSALQGSCEVIMLLSGDADQVAAVRAARDATRTVRVVFPPNRESSHLKDAADTAYRLNPDFLQQCQLPKHVSGAGSLVFTRPQRWD